MPSPDSLRARLALALTLEDRLAPAIFFVTNTNDAGAGSLRAAITIANVLPGADSIRFNIAGDGTRSIDLLSALPTITDSLKLAGRTQSGYAGSPLIELNGASAGLGASGLVIAPSAAGSIVRGAGHQSLRRRRHPNRRGQLPRARLPHWDRLLPALATSAMGLAFA